MPQLVDAAGLERLLTAWADGIGAAPAPSPVAALVGIRSRGVPLAQRLALLLEARLGRRLPVGQLDITFYRDDLTRRAPWPLVRGTDIPFPLEDQHIVLVDDVLFTGRTAHAAIAALLDLGRPALLRLAVLVDRGGREFPVQADFVGLRCDVPMGQRVAVRLAEIDGLDEIVIP
ncbi:MAG TPA: bifunctional pyr operon transcriptional regulator/uracil phosphoribosyltransferase PyrR [Gemmatales bacterium]|nr:bifunctional pyr operon transcriptional regulator/uracil phosphoribosyltransferase PyrR [Gemmatales bacterium]